jgi:O-antigen/teichoic acid export membrane protein
MLRDGRVAGRFSSAQLIKFALPILGFHVIVGVLMYMDILLIKAILMNDEKTGFYAAAQAVSKFLYFFFLPFSVVLLPQVSEAVSRKDVKRTRNYVGQSMRYLVILLLPMTLIFSVTSKKLIALIYGVSYAPAAEPLRVLFFGMCFWAAGSVLAAILQGADRPKTPTYLFFCLIPVDIVLQWVLIARYGLVGAAAASTITFFIGLGALIILTAREIGVWPDLASLLRVGFASTGIWLLSRGFYWIDIPVMVYYVLLLMVYAALLLLMKELTSDDWTFIKGIFRDRFHRVSGGGAGETFSPKTPT